MLKRVKKNNQNKKMIKNNIIIKDSISALVFIIGVMFTFTNDLTNLQNVFILLLMFILLVMTRRRDKKLEMTMDELIKELKKK